jgi:WD40 repeat protein/serine/threonine protein kinase
MNSSDSEADPLAPLAEEFADRYRRGERPSLTEYAARHPQLAERIRRIFPALMIVEEFGSVGATGPFVKPVPGPEEAASGRIDAPAGRQVGEYRILREIGRGGMGIVYEAVQESLGRHVALKVLPAHGLLAPTLLERFRREARAAAKLHHTNIVPVFGVGEHEGLHFYAMQFIQGQSLDSVVREVQRLRQTAAATQEIHHRAAANDLSVSIAEGLLTGRFADKEAAGSPHDASAPTPGSTLGSRTSGAAKDTQRSAQSDRQYFASVAQVGVQVAEGLAHAQQHGILHRDIKPSNLLLDTQGTVWITDFGLARAEGAEELTQQGDIVGTLRYMAPERFRGETDARSDLYGLGLTLYEMLTLRPAFAATERARLIERILHEEPPRPRQLDRRIPRDLETIVLKAMAKEPGERYATAAELAEDLRRFLADRPVQARRVAWTERTWRWCRRNRLVAGLMAFVGLTLVAGASVSAYFAIEADQRAKEKGQLAEEKTRLAEQKGKLAEDNGKLAKDNGKLAADEKALRQQAESDAARLVFEYGYRLCVHEDTAAGLVGVARALERAARAGDTELEWSIRAHLAAWSQQVQPLRAVLRHRGRINCVLVSPDNKIIVTGSEDHTARLWDAQSGKPLGGPLQHQGPVVCVAFTPDSKTVMTGSEDKANRFWDSRTGQAVSPPLGPQGEVITSGFSSPPGPERMQVGLQNLPDIRRDIRAWAYNRQGPCNFLTYHWDSTVRLWSDGNQPLALGPPLRHPDEIRCVAISPDGKRVVTGSADGTARLWEVKKAEAPVSVSRGFPTAISPDGKTFLQEARVLGTRFELSGAAVGKTKILQHDEPLKDYLDLVVEGTPFQGPRPAFSGDSKIALTPSYDGTARLWDAATGAPLGPPLQHAGPVFAVVLSPDGKLVLTGSFNLDTKKGEAQLWDAQTKTLSGPVLVEPGSVRAVAFSPDGKLFLTAGGEGVARLWNVVTRKQVGPDLRHQGRIAAVAFSPDGKTIATASRYGTARLWDVASGKALGAPLAHKKAVVCVAFSPDSKLVLTGSEDKTACLWEARTGRLLGPPIPQEGEVRTVAFSGDGQTFLTVVTGVGETCWWRTPVQPLAGQVERLVLWAQVITGLEVDEGGQVHALDGDSWHRRHERLQHLGGPPIP